MKGVWFAMTGYETPAKVEGVGRRTMAGMGRLPSLLLGALAALAVLGGGGAPGRAGAAEVGKRDLTFAKDVASIFQRKCQVCHHPGTVAPMSLMTYEEARPWIRSIEQRVSRREM